MTKIALIGEAWGEEEERQRAPFVGAAGWELTKMLNEAGIHRADCFISNVFNLRPRGNKIEELCGPKSDSLLGYPPLLTGKNARTGNYVRQEFASELERLSNELVEVDPNIIVALGNTAMWALTGKTSISKLRGATTLSNHCASGFKVLPTYHPAAILRQWDLRPIAVIDLVKAKRESLFPEIRRPFREIWIEPSLEDIYEFHERWIKTCSILSVDIETAGREVTCIGFAPGKSRAIVIPFYDPRKLGKNYWPTLEHEREVWNYIKLLLEGPTKKLFQNGLYDVSFLYRGYGIKVAGASEDTMLLHYSLQPESLKGLGFLGSCYTDELSWKDMRKHKTTIKRED